jgi:hypothetical protein
METTSVMAALNAMALTNVAPSNTPKQGNKSTIKGIITCSNDAVVYFMNCNCGKTKCELKV